MSRTSLSNRRIHNINLLISVVSFVNKWVLLMIESRHTHEWVTSHTWMSHVAHISRERANPQHTRRGTRTNESRVVSHVWTSHESLVMSRTSPANMLMHNTNLIQWYAHEWVMTHIWTSHGTYIWAFFLQPYGVATISTLLKVIGLFCRI